MEVSQESRGVGGGVGFDGEKVREMEGECVGECVGLTANVRCGEKGAGGKVGDDEEQQF